MNLADYPPQEPLSAMGQAYQDRLLDAGRGIDGIEHAYGDDAYQRLLVFPASRPSGDVLVFLHGGGWTNGYKEWMTFMAPALNDEGVTVVSPGYRLAPRHVHPAAFDDVADACAWVYAHVDAHGGDPQRLFVGGHSAGGHLASLLAVTSGWRASRGLPTNAIRGALPISGTYRFDADSGLSMRPRFLGPVEPVDLARDASPLFRIEPEVTPPFLVTWGERDFPHLVVQARTMVDALEAAGVPVTTDVRAGCDHFDVSLAAGDARSGWPARAAAWMQSAPAR